MGQRLHNSDNKSNEKLDIRSLNIRRRADLPYTEAKIVTGKFDRDKRLVSFSVSSESPYERKDFIEILSHAPGACDLTFMNSNRGNLTLDHKKLLGITLRMQTDDSIRKNVGEFRVTRNPIGDEALNDLEDEILVHSSCSYERDPDHMEVLGTDKRTQKPIIMVHKWTMFEASLQGADPPADMETGPNRSLETVEFEKNINDQNNENNNEGDNGNMGMRINNHQNNNQQNNNPQNNNHQNNNSQHNNNSGNGQGDFSGGDNYGQRSFQSVSNNNSMSIEEAQKQAAQRVDKIYQLGQRHNCYELAKRAVSEGTSLENFTAQLLDKISNDGPVGQRDGYQNEDQERRDGQPKYLNMSPSEIEGFSFTRAIRASMEKDWSQADFEYQVSREACRVYDKPVPGNGFVVPNDVLETVPTYGKRAGEETGNTNVASMATSIATDLRSKDFISMLRDATVIKKMGARVLSGLRGNVSIPKQEKGATGYWVGEREDYPRDEHKTGNVDLTFKTVGAQVSPSRQLLMQSSLDVEMLIRFDLAEALALQLDSKALFGDPTKKQPKGLTKYTAEEGLNIIKKTGEINWTKIVQMEAMIENCNVLGDFSYLCPPSIKGMLKTTPIDKSSNGKMVWQTMRDGVGEVNGYPAHCSNIIPISKTGTTSMILGKWSDCIVGEWGPGLTITVDPYKYSSTGDVVIIALLSADIVFRRLQSFCVFNNIQLGEIWKMMGKGQTAGDPRAEA